MCRIGRYAVVAVFPATSASLFLLACSVCFRGMHWHGRFLLSDLLLAAAASPPYHIFSRRVLVRSWGLATPARLLSRSLSLSLDSSHCSAKPMRAQLRGAKLRTWDRSVIFRRIFALHAWDYPSRLSLGHGCEALTARCSQVGVCVRPGSDSDWPGRFGTGELDRTIPGAARSGKGWGSGGRANHMAVEARDRLDQQGRGR